MAPQKHFYEKKPLSMLESSPLLPDVASIVPFYCPVFLALLNFHQQAEIIDFPITQMTHVHAGHYH